MCPSAYTPRILPVSALTPPYIAWQLKIQLPRPVPSRSTPDVSLFPHPLSGYDLGVIGFETQRNDWYQIVNTAGRMLIEIHDGHDLEENHQHSNVYRRNVFHIRHRCAVRRQKPCNPATARVVCYERLQADAWQRIEAGAPVERSCRSLVEVESSFPAVYMAMGRRQERSCLERLGMLFVTENAAQSQSPIDDLENCHLHSQ